MFIEISGIPGVPGTAESLPTVFHGTRCLAERPCSKSLEQGLMDRIDYLLLRIRCGSAGAGRRNE